MKLFITLLLLSSMACAVEDFPKENKEVNYCLNPQDAEDNEEQARNHPNDDELIKLVALRIGLCELVGKEIITVRAAVDMFEFERLKGMNSRWKEEIENSQDKLI